MNNFDKRLKRITKRLEQIINKEERTVAKRYASTLTELRMLLTIIYEKYEQGGTLTLEEMTKYHRLDKLMSDIDGILKTHYKDLYKDIYGSLGDVYTDGYYLTAWAVESEVKLALGYVAVRPETLSHMLTNPVHGLTLKQRLEKQRLDIIYSIQQTVTNGLQKNYTYSTMAKELKGVLEDDAVKAMRIVRTEGHRVQESAKFEAMEHATDNGVVMEKEWNTLEDNRVRKGKSNHRKLNGVTLSIDGEFNDGLGKGPAPGQLGAAGSDINCRCFLTYRIVDVVTPNKKVVEEVTFEQFERERIKGVARK